MKFPSRYFVAVALLAAPISVAAQTAQAPAHGEHAREGRGAVRGRPGAQSPVQRLIAQRQRLALTDAQVQRLQAIDRDLQSRNAPLQQQLAALFPERSGDARQARPRGERRARPDSAQRAERRARRPERTEEQRRAMEQKRAQAQPIVQQMRQNGEAALTQARGVLSAEQQRQVQRMLERRGPRGERGARRDGEQVRGGAAQSR